MKNSQFQLWFSQGNIVDALTGVGDFFIPDVTYHDDHDFGLAVRQLIIWSKEGHESAATKGFEQAIARLLQANDLKSAFLLMRSYALQRGKPGCLLPLDLEKITDLVACSVRKCEDELARNEELRGLALLIAKDFPFLKSKIGLK